MCQEDFFYKYNIDPLAFDRCSLTWPMLEEIRDKYETMKPGLETCAKYSVEELLKCRKVHSINYRIKETDHLLEKIIRKTVADPSRSINADNFSAEITDLIGVRTLHLFKEDWKDIHGYLCDNWELYEKPTAYYRQGDSRRILDYYQENNCRIEENPYGYRSVHYLVKSGLGKVQHITEIQVRTIFEEAWGEIDHTVRYPYFADNEMLVRLSSILNKLAGDADELGTYMRYLKIKTQSTDAEHRRELQEKNRIIDDLRRQINELEIDKEQKSDITESLNELEAQDGEKSPKDDEFPWLDTFIDSPLFKTISSRIGKFVREQNEDPIELSEKEVEMMQKAGSELIGLLDNPEKLEKLAGDKHTMQLISELEKKIGSGGGK